MDFLNRFFKNTQIPNLMKICPASQAVPRRQMDGRGKANSPKTGHWQITRSSERPSKSMAVASVHRHLWHQHRQSTLTLWHEQRLSPVSEEKKVCLKHSQLRESSAVTSTYTMSDLIHTLPPSPVLPRSVANDPHYLYKQSNPLRQRWTPMMNPPFITKP